MSPSRCSNISSSSSGPSTHAKRDSSKAAPKLTAFATAAAAVAAAAAADKNPWGHKGMPESERIEREEFLAAEILAGRHPSLYRGPMRLPKESFRRLEIASAEEIAANPIVATLKSYIKQQAALPKSKGGRRPYKKDCRQTAATSTPTPVSFTATASVTATDDEQEEEEEEDCVPAAAVVDSSSSVVDAIASTTCGTSSCLRSSPCFSTTTIQADSSSTTSASSSSGEPEYKEVYFGGLRLHVYPLMPREC